VTYNRNIRNN